MSDMLGLFQNVSQKRHWLDPCLFGRNAPSAPGIRGALLNRYCAVVECAGGGAPSA